MSSHLTYKQLEQVLILPVWVFTISFAGGTALAAAYMLNKNLDFLFITGFLYILLATAINLMVLGGMLAIAWFNTAYRRQILIHTSLLLLNIPIAMGYFIFIFII